MNANLATGVVTGGSGNDTLAAIENLLGSAYGDSLIGSGGANSIEGGLGDDVLAGEGGTDTLSYASSASGSDSVACGRNGNRGEGRTLSPALRTSLVPRTPTR